MKKTKILLSLLLAALLLAGCGAPPAAVDAPSPEPERETVVVTDLAGLLNALAPGRCIEIDAAELHLEEAADYGFGYPDGPYTWEAVGGGEYVLVLQGLEDLTIRSAREDGTVLNTGVTVANVLTLRSCRDLTLEGLTFGHRTEAAFCLGDVLFCDGCEDLVIRLCDLFGCGATAVNAWKCTRLFLEDCTLHDCSVSAINATLCTNLQARDCRILRCGRDSGIASVCAASCNGFALINTTIRDCGAGLLLDSMNSSSVCLLGCEASGNRFSEALFRIYDGGVTVSGSALTDNEFANCYAPGSSLAVTESGKKLNGVSDLLHMEHSPFTGDYIGPAPYVTPGDVYADPAETWVTPGDVFPLPLPVYTPTEWDGERAEIHVKTVDELLAAVAPHTIVYLDGEEFDLSTASDYGGSGGDYYVWSETFDGPELVLVNLEDFTLVGGGMGVTLLSAQPRYADVLSFDNCFSICLSDMTVGHHEEPGYCSGGVLNFLSCGGVTVERCGLFGCGTVGITATSSRDLFVSDVNIYDCSYVGAQLYGVQNMCFTGCSISDCGWDYGFNGIQIDESTLVSYNGEELSNGQYMAG